MERASHGTKCKYFLVLFLVTENEHTLFIMVPVSRNLIKVRLCHKRSFCKQPASLFLLVLNPTLKSLDNLCSLRKKNGESLTDIIYRCEKFKFSAEFIMVTLFCLLESGKVLLKHRSLWKCNTVNTAKHLVFLIASPICARALSQLKRFNDFHIHKVRSCAKLRKLALLIKADVFAFCGVLLDEFNFIRLVLLLHKFNCLINRKFKSCNFRIFFDNLLHLCFNLEQILGRK